MSDKNNVGAHTPAPTSEYPGPNERPTQENYSTKDKLDIFLESLPDPELRAKIQASVAREVQKTLSDQDNDDLSALVPPLATTPASAILLKEFPEIAWTVPQYMPPGFTFLFGKPKVGKSWLALQLALSVTTGGKLLNQDVAKGRVLYLALEDYERRLKKRMVAQNWPANPNVDFMLPDQFRAQIGALNSGGGKALVSYVQRQKYRMVVVDTFSRAFRGEQKDVSDMTAAITPIQEYAGKNDVSFLVVDHEGKYSNSLFGSIGKEAVAETFWRLFKEQGYKGAKLQIWGRDLEDEYLMQLEFVKDGCYWSSLGDAQELAITQRRQEILDLLQDVGRLELKDIAEGLSADKPNTLRRLNDLCDAGKLKREEIYGKTFYSLA